MDGTAHQRETEGTQKQSSPVVKCDVCGGTFNRSYLWAHKRLSHGKKLRAAPRVTNDATDVETILALYLRISAKARKEVLERLAWMSEPSHD